MNRLLTELDHVMLAVHDHANAVAAWQRLGFTVRPVRQLVPMGGGAAGGNGGSAAVLLHAAAPGCANFIELAMADPTTAAPALKTLLRGPEGVALLVHATPDPQALAQDWSARGWRCQSIRMNLPPMGAGEPVQVDIVLPEPGSTPLAFNAMRMSSTADFERDEWRSHPNSARRWSGIVYVETAAQMLRTRALLQSLYGEPGQPDVNDGWTFRPGNVALTLMTDAAFIARFGDVADSSVRSRPSGALLSFEVDALDRARAHLNAHHVAHADRGDAILIAAAQVLGVAIELRGPR